MRVDGGLLCPRKLEDCTAKACGHLSKGSVGGSLRCLGRWRGQCGLTVRTRPPQVCEYAPAIEFTRRGVRTGNHLAGAWLRGHCLLAQPALCPGRGASGAGPATALYHQPIPNPSPWHWCPRCPRPQGSFLHKLEKEKREQGEEKGEGRKCEEGGASGGFRAGRACAGPGP